MSKEYVSTDFVFRAGVSPVEGNMKIAAIRSVIYNYAYHRHLQISGAESTFILKCDDADSSNPSHKEVFWQINDLYRNTIGIRPDIDPQNSIEVLGDSLFQSERKQIYQAHAAPLLEKGLAFRDKAGSVIFDVAMFAQQFPNDHLLVEDDLLGSLSFSVSETETRLKAFPILRADGLPLYHFASVIDDYTLGVTHVVRGQDKIPAIPYQEMLRISLNLPEKRYLHTPLLLDGSGKRLKGSYLFTDMIRQGISYEALLTYLINSGYGKGDVTYLDLDSFSENFDYRAVHKNSGMFDRAKLENTNRKLVPEMDKPRYIHSMVTFLRLSKREDLALTLQSRLDLQQMLNQIRPDLKSISGILDGVIKPEYSLSEQVDTNLVKLIVQNLKIGLDLDAVINISGVKNKTEFFATLNWLLIGIKDGKGAKVIYDSFRSSSTLEDRLKKVEMFLSETKPHD